MKNNNFLEKYFKKLLDNFIKDGYSILKQEKNKFTIKKDDYIVFVDFDKNIYPETGHILVYNELEVLSKNGSKKSKHSKWDFLFSESKGYLILWVDERWVFKVDGEMWSTKKYIKDKVSEAKTLSVKK